MFLLNNNCCAHPSSGPLYSFITASTVLSWQCTGHCQCIHAHALRTLCWHKPLCIVAKHACNRVFYFQYGSIILPRLWASIGVTRSYSSRPFLCALAIVYVGGILSPAYQSTLGAEHVKVYPCSQAPSHHPVSDCLQYIQKKTWSIFTYCKQSKYIRVYFRISCTAVNDLGGWTHWRHMC